MPPLLRTASLTNIDFAFTRVRPERDLDRTYEKTQSGPRLQKRGQVAPRSVYTQFLAYVLAVDHHGLR